MQIGQFEILAAEGKARAGRFHTAHGAFHTPAFMPVGTQASVKGMTPRQLKENGSEIILSNAYHLHLRPGDELIKELGGLHTFMGWDGPILTDSGGYQVFSLANLRTVSDQGVFFQSHIDGAAIEFTPEKVIAIQENLGVDIMMVLDECAPYPCEKEKVRDALERTMLWAQRSLAVRSRRDCLCFGIIQGGVFEDLRSEAAERLTALPFDGYAIGGVSVGEPGELIRDIPEFVAPQLPPEKPRYLMGVGTPTDIIRAVSSGVDMFDCVIPTRGARFARIFTQSGRLNLRNNRFRRDPDPLDADCDCYTCQHFSRAYLAHLIHTEEILAIELATLHNLRFYERLLVDIRLAITEARFQQFAESCLDTLSHSETSEPHTDP